MNNSLSCIPDNLRHVRERIARAAEACNRDPGGITLVAVSKTHPAATVRVAHEAGQAAFGENKAQEILKKAPALPGSLEWHFIGHLQSNKVRKVLPWCALIHSVDSLKLARRIDFIADELDLRPRVLLQVNVAGDEAKFGFSPDSLREAMGEILALERLRVDGLMTVPPFRSDPEEVRPSFAALRQLRNELAEATGADMPELSMGMSHDFEHAIAEGATLVRVGSGIFGEREYR